MAKKSKVAKVIKGNSRIAKFLAMVRKPCTLATICKAFKLEEKKVRSLVDYARSKGYNVARVAPATVQLKSGSWK